MISWLLCFKMLEEYLLYGRASTACICAADLPLKQSLCRSCSPLVSVPLPQALWTQDNTAVVYPCHAIIVTLQIQTREQRFFIGHTDKVSVTLLTKPYGSAALVPQGYLGPSSP